MGGSKVQDKFKGLYSVNWQGLFEVVQSTLMENIVENTSYMGKYHCRVLRILKEKGYLADQTLSQMSMLPGKDIKAILNTLLKEGMISYTKVPTTTPSKSGNLPSGPTTMMYGPCQPKMLRTMQTKLL